MIIVDCEIDKFAEIFCLVDLRSIRRKPAVCGDKFINRLHDGVGVYDFQSRNTCHKVGNIIVSGLHHDVLGGAHLHHFAVTHDGDAITDPNSFVEVMCNEDRCFLENFAEADELVLQLASDQRIQRREWFVHQQNVRVRRKRALVAAYRQKVHEQI